MYEVTFCDTGRTMNMTRMDAEDLLGKDDFELALNGYLPHIVVVEL